MNDKKQGKLIAVSGAALTLSLAMRRIIDYIVRRWFYSGHGLSTSLSSRKDGPAIVVASYAPPEKKHRNRDATAFFLNMVWLESLRRILGALGALGLAISLTSYFWRNSD